MRIKLFEHMQLWNVIALIFILLSSSIRAEKNSTIDQRISHAIGVLKGIYTDMTQEQAVYVLNDAAENMASPIAMNALGLMYTEGIGVKTDVNKGIYWMEAAGQHGIADAYHNIGAVYKNGKAGIKQDFKKAFEAFHKGCLAGSMTCTYDAGFMLYKGLGCNQNYEQSIKMFETAANSGHVPSMYMLGLCYRNGYGTEQDEDKGRMMLQKAADLGSEAAIRELLLPTPENCMQEIMSSNNPETFSNTFLPTIESELNDTALLRGNYQGVLTTYDWSGEFILSIKPIEMTIHRGANDKVYGNMVIENDTIPYSADIQPNGSLKYNNSYTSLNERYTAKGKAKYKLIMPPIF